MAGVEIARQALLGGAPPHNRCSTADVSTGPPTTSIATEVAVEMVTRHGMNATSGSGPMRRRATLPAGTLRSERYSSYDADRRRGWR